jgi:hypothetical protein
MKEGYEGILRRGVEVQEMEGRGAVFGCPGEMCIESLKRVIPSYSHGV